MNCFIFHETLNNSETQEKKKGKKTEVEKTVETKQTLTGNSIFVT